MTEYPCATCGIPVQVDPYTASLLDDPDRPLSIVKCGAHSPGGSWTASAGRGGDTR